MWAQEVAMLAHVAEDDVRQRLEEYLERIGSVLGNKHRRASFATYAMGLLGDGERKSMEPIAARACASPDQIEAQHQRLGHFIRDANWSDRNIRLEASRYALELMTAREPVSTWILDDTGFLKQGTHSVGVQRQYTGSAGKITNCQIGVSLSVATRADHLPIDFELYLPEAWIADPERREEARVPSDLVFKTKPELALQMLDRALEDSLPRGIVLADEGYGNSSEFRKALRERELDYAVAVSASTTVWVADRNGKLGQLRRSVRELARELGEKRFRRTTWREGTRGLLHARFAVRRVVVGSEKGRSPSKRESQWLLMEWRNGEPEPGHFYLLTLPEKTSRKQMVRIVKERYRTERVYEDLKGELGLDHFEGRTFPGWHHHVSVALCCYAFVTAEKLRTFFSTTGRQRGTRPNRFQTGAPLRGLVHHNPLGYCACPQHLAPALPPLSHAEPLAISAEVATTPVRDLTQ
jgi:SRSO17 transposase